MYYSVTLDRTKGGLAIIASEKGGIHIEESDPNYIKTFSIDFPNTVEEIDHAIYAQVAEVLKLNDHQANQLKTVISISNLRS